MTGGYLDIENLDTLEMQRHFYSGSSNEGGGTVFILDLQPPTHCSLVPPSSSSSCQPDQPLLSLGAEEVTGNASVSASWGGWSDAPSGLTQYELSVYQLEVRGGLLEEGRLLASSVITESGQTSYENTTELLIEGAYSFVLRTFDLAGNVRLSRRIVLYDASSTLEIDPSAPLLVSSGTEVGGDMWQNSTTSPLVVSGRGHFYNTLLRANDYLAPLGNFSPPVAEEFDQPVGGRLSRLGTLNALGVVQIDYTIAIDQLGGVANSSLTTPTEFPFQSSDLAIDALEVSTSLRDGDSVTIWLQATDFNFQTISDSVLVHVDSSPPVAGGLGLERNGVSGLVLHGTDSLLDLNIEFSAFDTHSGLYAIEWRIGLGPDTPDVGSGSLPIPEVRTCMCYSLTGHTHITRCGCGLCGVTAVLHLLPPLLFPSAVVLCCRVCAWRGRSVCVTFWVAVSPPASPSPLSLPPSPPPPPLLPATTQTMSSQSPSPTTPCLPPPSSSASRSTQPLPCPESCGIPQDQRATSTTNRSSLPPPLGGVSSTAKRTWLSISTSLA